MPSPEIGSNSPEGDTALAEIDRHELLAELARAREENAGDQATLEVVHNPELAAMLAILIESGVELPAQTQAHLRRMITLSYCFYTSNQAAEGAATDAEFHALIAHNVQSELEEFYALYGTDQPADLWDIAYEDLIHFEGHEG